MTDTVSHSPEPWRVDDRAKNRSSASIRGANGKAVAACRIKGPDGLRWPEVTYADAARIVACVNACAGIATEELEAVVSTDRRVLRLLCLANVARSAADRAEPDRALACGQAPG